MFQAFIFGGLSVLEKGRLELGSVELAITAPKVALPQAGVSVDDAPRLGHHDGRRVPGPIEVRGVDQRVGVGRRKGVGEGHRLPTTEVVDCGAVRLAEQQGAGVQVVLGAEVIEIEVIRFVLFCFVLMEEVMRT